MIPLFRSELRKLLTVRSTYILSVVSALLVALFAFYVEGYRGASGSAASTLKPAAFTEIISASVGIGITFATIIAILFIAHEYRYNMIMYTLTANVRRTKVLFAKLLTMVGFGVIYGLATAGFGLLCYLIGIELRGANLAPQSIEAMTIIGRLAYYCAAYVLIGVLIAVISRSVIVGIAAFLIVPTTAEPLLSLLLKDNAKYLPFTSLDSTLNVSMLPSTLSPGKAMMVSGAYVAVALVITWILFVRRDAN